MGRPAKIDPEKVRRMKDQGWTQSDIAAVLHVSEAAISKCVANMETREAALADGPAVQQARISVWNIRQKLEWLQDKTEEILVNHSFDPLERIAAVNSMVAQLRFAMTALTTLHSIEEQAAFQEEVLTILEECAPGTREKILQRIREKRPLRAALLSSGGTVPGTQTTTGS